MNKAWHAKHPMPKPATLAKRVAWHDAHAAACACRAMPPAIAAELAKRAKKRKVPKR